MYGFDSLREDLVPPASGNAARGTSAGGAHAKGDQAHAACHNIATIQEMTRRAVVHAVGGEGVAASERHRLLQLHLSDQDPVRAHHRAGGAASQQQQKPLTQRRRARQHTTGDRFACAAGRAPRRNLVVEGPCGVAANLVRSLRQGAVELQNTASTNTASKQTSSSTTTLQGGRTGHCRSSKPSPPAWRWGS